jgi:hypothetical protein
MSYIGASILFLIAILVDVTELNHLQHTDPNATAQGGAVAFVVMAAILQWLLFWMGVVSGLGTFVGWRARKKVTGNFGPTCSAHI